MRPPLRSLGHVATGLLPAAFLAACALENMSSGSGSKGTDAGAAATDAASDAGPALRGAGCGVEPESGMTLCAATSACPNVAVDTQALPTCGFRIQGSSASLVCGCNGAVCPMGTYQTCAQAAELLTSQTLQGVCTQVAEGRCAAGSGGTSTSSSGGTKTGCDRGCLSECGGGAACASLCGC
jgi:hypothetical protein